MTKLYNQMTIQQIKDNLFEFEYAIRNKCNGYNEDDKCFRTYVFVFNLVLTGFGNPNYIINDESIWIFEKEYQEWLKVRKK